MSPTNFNQIQSTFGTFTGTVTFSTVTIYEGANYQGKSVQLSIGKHRLLGQADLNDQISSIKVPPGLAVLVYEHADEGGGYGMWADLLEDCPDLSPVGMGDKISFLDVFSTETREGFVWIRNAMVNGAFVAGHWERKRATAQPPQGTAPVVRPTLPPHSLPTPPAFSSRVIHISDLHCTSNNHTLGQISNGVLHRDFQDSASKLRMISSFLLANKANLDADTVVITGDLTDSGDDGDYTEPQKGVLQFIATLRASGFHVFSVPGNHDYCKEGNQFLTIETGVTEGENTRRKRFLQYITPQYMSAPKYPHFEDLKDPKGKIWAHLVLLDSMQEELDGNTNNNRAQGTLGKQQLDALTQKLNQFQSDRVSGIPVIVALHHSPFQGQGDSELSDRYELLNAVNGKIDCLLYGHVTKNGIYQVPKYTTPNTFADDAAVLVEAQTQYQISLINCENLEDMSSTLPVTVLDLKDNTRTVHYLKPYTLHLSKVVCNNAATMAGDDLEIYIDGNSVSPAEMMKIDVSGNGKAKEIVNVIYSAVESIDILLQNLLAGPRDQINIDTGQTYQFDLEFGVGSYVKFDFREDGDYAGELNIDAYSLAGKGQQKVPVKIKSDGRYDIYFSVMENKTELSYGYRPKGNLNVLTPVTGAFKQV